MTSTLSEQAVFRATFLLNLGSTYAETLRAMGEMLEVLFRNLETDAESESAHLGLHERAVVADLRSVAATLGWIAKHTTASGLSEEEFAIAARAKTLTPHLLRLIEEMGGSLATEETEPSRVRQRLTMRTDFWVLMPSSLAHHLRFEAGDEVEWEVVPEGLLLRKVPLATGESGPGEQK